MTRGQCHEVEALIDREAQGWSDAERLRVEDHLASCVSCLETLSVARLVRETIEQAPYELSNAARERAIGRAFARTDGIEIRTGQQRRKILGWSGSALVAAAAAALLLFASQRDTELASKPVPPAPASAAIAVASPEQHKSSDALAPEPAWIETREPTRRTFAHASVELAAATRVRFDTDDTTLTLDRGRVDVDVDVSRGRAFSVTTAHFRVQVLGTRFVVTPDAVHVARGRVQVFGLDGSVLARDLGAGASFSYELSRARQEPHRKVVAARVWLARAREALAHGNTKSARELIERAEHSEPQRADRAEASTLRAEAALLDREPKAAVRLYLGVSERFPDLVAGENAAFAAAQLSARAEPARERQLLGRYLKRYPSGRFADEAKQRLKKLGAR